MTRENSKPEAFKAKAAVLGPRLAPEGLSQKPRQHGPAKYLYKRILNSGTFDGRKIAVLRSRTSHKTVRQSASDVITNGMVRRLYPA